MNFLAHQHLSFHVPPVMVGNFIADTIRGSQLEKYPVAIGLGIRVHRAIDTFTDSHPTVLATRTLLYPHFGKYAAVVQDVFYDHFLAINWHQYSPQPLKRFVDNVYATLEANRNWMNERALRTLFFMHSQNWLEGYLTSEGIDRALKGLSRRARFTSNMENSMPALEENYQVLNDQFQGFYTELIEEIKRTFGREIEATRKR